MGTKHHFLWHREHYYRSFEELAPLTVVF
jgi:hypothetical protein